MSLSSWACALASNCPESCSLTSRRRPREWTPASSAKFRRRDTSQHTIHHGCQASALGTGGCSAASMPDCPMSPPGPSRPGWRPSTARPGPPPAAWTLDHVLARLLSRERRPLCSGTLVRLVNSAVGQGGQLAGCALAAQVPGIKGPWRICSGRVSLCFVAAGSARLLGRDYRSCPPSPGSPTTSTDRSRWRPIRSPVRSPQRSRNSLPDTCRETCGPLR